MALVLLPCELPWWPVLQQHLNKISKSTCIDEFLEMMLVINKMCSIGLDPDDTDEPSLSIFENFRNFLVNGYSSTELDHFLKHTLANMCKHALNLKDLRPFAGVQFSLQQQEDKIELERSLVASLLSHAFFSTFPKRTHKTHPTLQDFNFTYFFPYLNLKHQEAKLRSFFHYFDLLENSEIIPKSTITISRQVMSGNDWLTSEDWLECNIPLCPMVIKHDCRMENYQQDAIYINFSNKKIGGNVLTDGNSLECIQMITCPEMLVTLLFIEALEDNEVVIVENIMNVSKINNPKQKPYFEAFEKPKMIKICSIDAENYTKFPEHQYEEDSLLRELNKAFLGFRQEQQPLLRHSNRRSTRRLSPIGESFSSTPKMDDKVVDHPSKLTTKSKGVTLASSGDFLPINRKLTIDEDFGGGRLDDSSPEEYYSANDRTPDEEGGSEVGINVRRYSAQLDTPERRRLFAERLKDALRRANSNSTSDSNYAVGISVSGSSLGDCNIRMKRGGSRGFVLEDEKPKDCSGSSDDGIWFGKTGHLKKDAATSSKYSFSTDYTTELEDVYDQLSQWLDDAGVKKVLGGNMEQEKIRNNAIVEFAGSLLKRTLSESFLGTSLNCGHYAVEGSKNYQKKDTLKMAARSLSLEISKNKEKLTPQLLSIMERSTNEGDLRSIVTGNWGCGSRCLGDPQIKLLIQWAAASALCLPSIVYYTCSHQKLLKLDTLYRILVDRKWSVGKIVKSLLAFSRDGAYNDIFEKIIENNY